MSLRFDPRPWMGIPYVYGGRNLQGCDCFGLISLIFKSRGINVDDPAKEWREDWFLNTNQEQYLKEINLRTLPIEDVDVSPYDLLYFYGSSGKVTHAGIVVDEFFFIHSLKGIGSLLSRRKVWNKRQAGIARLKELC